MIFNKIKKRKGLCLILAREEIILKMHPCKQDLHQQNHKNQ